MGRDRYTLGFYKDREGYDAVDKDPNEVLDYSVKWENLLGVGEGIASIATEVDGTVVVDSTEISGTDSIIWLSGDPGSVSLVTVRVTTNNTVPRILDRSFRVYGVEK